ncbi:hypothetical protein EDD85DRAFT_970834 [Armillaria nabsnona]|nr:hypothetical protein EDD85DRAFT_970834 [Armillaria nabsnona]
MQAKSKAVIISIDAYPRYPLYGCVSDAELMEKYFVEDLGVPKDRIQRLLDPIGQKTADSSTSPTRANIIRTLYSLIDNPAIMRGDNIVVYFAGNGAFYDAQEYYCDKVPPEVSIASMRSIQALCPMDHGASDDTGSEIPDISVREIDAIVTQISQPQDYAHPGLRLLASENQIRLSTWNTSLTSHCGSALTSYA